MRRVVVRDCFLHFTFISIFVCKNYFLKNINFQLDLWAACVRMSVHSIALLKPNSGFEAQMYWDKTNSWALIIKKTLTLLLIHWTTASLISDDFWTINCPTLIMMLNWLDYAGFCFATCGSFSLQKPLLYFWTFAPHYGKSKFFVPSDPNQKV